VAAVSGVLAGPPLGYVGWGGSRPCSVGSLRRPDGPNNLVTLMRLGAFIPPKWVDYSQTPAENRARLP
jgi:hypothetical protein